MTGVFGGWASAEQGAVFTQGFTVRKCTGVLLRCGISEKDQRERFLQKDIGKGPQPIGNKRILSN